MLLGAALPLAPVAAAEPEVFAGQPLADALRLLSSRHGLATVFSPDTVPETLRVQPVPPAADPRALREALLAQHGLRCLEIHARCVVERAPRNERSQAREPARAAPDPQTRLPEVRVVPSHYSLVSEGANFLSAADIAATPHLADDVFRLARAIPGVAGGDIAAPFHVRGGQSDEIALRLDGLELYKPFHLHNLINALGIVDSNLIGGIDFYTGAWPSRFGGRMSAVMDIRSRELDDERERSLGVSAINAFYTHARSWDDGDRGLLASARRGYLDVVLNFVDPDGRIDPGYYDVFARYTHRLNDAHRLSAHVLHAGDDILFDGESGDHRSDGRSDAGYFWLRWQADWSGRLSGETLLAHTRIDRRRHGFTLDDFDTHARVADDRRLHGLRLGHRLNWQWSERTGVEAGIEWRSETARYDYRSAVETWPPFASAPIRYRRDARIEVDGDQWATWLDIQSTLSEHWQLRGGLRHARYAPEARDDDALDPHIALSWRPHAARELRFGLSRASQAQRADELAVEDGETFFHAPERAHLAVLAWEERLSAALRLRAELFHKRWDRLRPRYENLFEPIELFPEAEGDRIRVDADRADSRGIELGLDGTWSESRWWARYAYSRTRERVDGAWQPRSWDQPHALHAGMDRRFGRGWRLTAQLDAHSGWPTTPASVVALPDGGHGLVVGERNADRFAPYVNLSARLSREHALSDGTLVWYVEIFNLLDRQNGNLVEEFLLVRNGDGSFRVQRRYGGGMPLLPSFGVVWRF